MATELLDPPQSCPQCESPLDQLEYVCVTENGTAVVEADGWAPASERIKISCANGHRYVAIYEQREPWLRVLVGAGAELLDAWGPRDVS